MSQYFGKYRAIVTNVSDPEKRGRVKVMCPRIFGEYESAWCEPCIPFAYERGGDFAIPRLNDFIWVEFEEGDVDRPIWCGGLWSVANSSCSEYNTDKRVIEFLGARIEMSAEYIILSVGGAKVRLQNGNVYLN